MVSSQTKQPLTMPFTNLVTAIETAEDRRESTQNALDFDAYYNETVFADIDELEAVYALNLGGTKLDVELDYPDYF